ncbi:MAG: hypothetical protein IRZ31_20840 [Thermogemmatispora sp.]|uniref:hypothetical protein n=1 Tax=Thermogemmatispora sp. TaxID=1968838 RepID=UPI002618C2E2|nr:hypothetical protein [Thermogemmatispora sp.]MBX5459345.1 hypothetical protein [Thermogemmatispora sp.]
MDRRDDQSEHQQTWKAESNPSLSPLEQLHLPLEDGEQVLLEGETFNSLREAGLRHEEIQRLLLLRRRVRRSGEIPPYLSGDPRLQFARWLYEHGAISEFSDAEEEAS